MSTKEIMANGLTKALPVIKHEHFVGMTDINNKKIVDFYQTKRQS